MSNIRNQTVTTTDAEKITTGGQDQQAVVDLDSQQLLINILETLQKIELHLSMMTGEEL